MPFSTNEIVSAQNKETKMLYPTNHTHHFNYCLYPPH